jgi:hypothetical protein
MRATTFILAMLLGLLPFCGDAFADDEHDAALDRAANRADRMNDEKPEPEPVHSDRRERPDNHPSDPVESRETVEKAPDRSPASEPAREDTKAEAAELHAIRGDLMAHIEDKEKRDAAMAAVRDFERRGSGSPEQAEGDARQTADSIKLMVERYEDQGVRP